MQNRREITDFPAVCEVIVKALSQKLLTAGDEVGEGLAGKQTIGQKGEVDHLMEQFASSTSTFCSTSSTSTFTRRFSSTSSTKHIGTTHHNSHI